jgi:hypothetical protein
MDEKKYFEYNISLKILNYDLSKIESSLKHCNDYINKNLNDSYTEYCNNYKLQLEKLKLKKIDAINQLNQKYLGKV